MMHQFKRWADATQARAMLKDDNGAALVEYGLLVGLIAVVSIAAVTALGTNVKTVFCDVNGALVGSTLAGMIPGVGC